MKVLLVEDDDGFAKVLATVLVSCQITVYRVSTLSEAMSEAAIQQPDVILLDLNLPDSRLHDTIRAIPDLKKAAPDSQVCVMTGSIEAGLEEESRSFGATSFANKAGGMGSRKDILSILLESLKQGNKTVAENIAILEKAIGAKLT